MLYVAHKNSLISYAESTNYTVLGTSHYVISWTSFTDID